MQDVLRWAEEAGGGLSAEAWRRTSGFELLFISVLFNLGSVAGPLSASVSPYAQREHAGKVFSVVVISTGRYSVRLLLGLPGLVLVFEGRE